MRSPGVKLHAVRGLGDVLLLLSALAAALGGGGCSALIGAELSDKADGTGGVGGQGGQSLQGDGGDLDRPDRDGRGEATSSGDGQTASSGAGGGSDDLENDEDEGDGESASGGAGGGLTCPDHRADCDGDAENGCETRLKNDPDHCGSCGNACSDDSRCHQGECE
ncbi:uncharacterized protein SOCEGT47_060900 [Sorangium cellulosum]|uniref:Uncharacterized protein n=1 Tax=Sorangium cellulosum TaxID=56 RepID=A0A4P2Q901_SORCE|nr:hypothetical protein [Sorangium cellulosum]AUX25543.1 uncharacterized protein SOCEGT47_060900 [Sorangium cellulosum]